MRKYNDEEIDAEILNFEAMHKTAIKIKNATKILKKFTVTLNSENQFKYLINNLQFFVLFSISKIDSFTFSMTKFIFKTENINQLI